MIPVLIVVAAIVVLVVIVLTRRGKDETVEVLDGPIRTIDADLVAGSLVVLASDGPVEIQRATEWMLKKPALSQTLDHGTLTLRATGSPLLSGVVGWTVRTPADVQVHVRALSAFVSLDGVAGGATIETTSGAVSIDGIGDEVSITSDVGEISGEGVVARRVHIKTRNGAVNLGFATAPESVNVTTEGAAITIAVPAGSADVVHADAGEGNVTVTEV